MKHTQLEGFLLLFFVCLSTRPLCVGGEVSREGHGRFADALTNELYKNDNECSSSWGVSLMFDLLYPGGTERTPNEMCSVMSLCNMPATTNGSSSLHWKDTISRLTTAYDGRCVDQNENECFLRAPTVEIANSVWRTTGDQLTPEYEAVVGEFLEETDFTSPNAGAVVNEWVNASTRGLIDSIVDYGPLSPPFVLLALNSIYLKANWLFPFAERHTNTDNFYASPSRTEQLPKPVNFMHMVEFFPYSHDAIPGYQMVQLGYAASALSMVVVLPTDDDLVPVMSEKVLEVLPSLQSQRVALALPRFRFESKYKENLEEALQTIGLMAPFSTSGGGGFCGIFDNGGCQWLDLIVQKTVIDVNEVGPVAAAVTLGGLIESAPADVPVLFLADHGFQFFLYDESEDLVLFEGRVGAPEVVDGTTPAQLQTTHSDPEFWTMNFFVDPMSPPRVSSTDSPTSPPSGASADGKLRHIFDPLFLLLSMFSCLMTLEHI